MRCGRASVSRWVVFSIVAALILVFGVFAALKISTTGKQAGKGTAHGLIEKSPAAAFHRSNGRVPHPPLNSPIPRSMQSTAVNEEQYLCHDHDRTGYERAPRSWAAGGILGLTAVVLHRPIRRLRLGPLITR